MKITKAVFTLFFFFGILLISFFILIKEVLAQKAPSLEFSATSKIIRLDETFSVDLIVDTAGNDAFGTGAKITFDPEVLEVVLITPGNIFGDYPALSFDNTEGKVIISGISSSIKNAYNGRGIFATLTFRAIKKGGTTVQFIYEPGSTTDSNIAVTDGTGDILANVNTLLVTITQGIGGETSVPMTNIVQQKVTASENIFTKIFRFLGLVKEPEAVRTGRTQTAEIDAFAPIPSQEPITDANQNQPESVVASGGSNFSRIIFFLLAIITSVGIFLLVRRFLRSRKTEATGIKGDSIDKSGV